VDPPTRKLFELTNATELPAATKLALDRTRLAHERTLMVWVRPSMSLIVRLHHPQGLPVVLAAVIAMLGIVGLAAMLYRQLSHDRAAQVLAPGLGFLACGSLAI
jgi:hypothetical protein